MRYTFAVIAAVVLSVFPALGEEPRQPPDAAACWQRRIPEPGSVRAVRMVAIDRAGSQRTTVAKIYRRRSEEGWGNVYLRVVEPPELRGTAFLMLEREGENEIYFKSTEVPGVKRIRAAGRDAGIFGTDFSYEDFEQFRGLSRRGEQKRLEDAVISNRPVYVVETRPADPASSAYARIVSFIDKEKCVALRMELYEAGNRLRKEIIVNSHQVLKRGSVWIPHMAVIRDIRQFTTTQFLVDSSEQEEVVPESMFTVEALEQEPR